MNRVYRELLVTTVAVLCTVMMSRAASAQCVSGSSTAQLITSGPHAGLYKYTITITWDTPSGLSNVTLDCQFDEQCPGAPEEACNRTWEFDTPAGTSDGQPAPCTVEYAGEFNCQGNPSIGLNGPIVKWVALNTGGCEPGNTGTATLCFYTDSPPASNHSLPVILIKNGQNVCEGTITGDCPFVCTVPVEPVTWGTIKARYR